MLMIKMMGIGTFLFLMFMCNIFSLYFFNAHVFFLIKILKSNFLVFKKGKKKSLGENDKNILD